MHIKKVSKVKNILRKYSELLSVQNGDNGKIERSYDPSSNFENHYNNTQLF